MRQLLRGLHQLPPHVVHQPGSTRPCPQTQRPPPPLPPSPPPPLPPPSQSPVLGEPFSSSPASVWGKKPAPRAQCSTLFQQHMKGGLAGGRIQVANGSRCCGRSAAAEGNTTSPEKAEPWYPAIYCGRGEADKRQCHKGKAQGEGETAGSTAAWRGMRKGKAAGGGTDRCQCHKARAAGGRLIGGGAREVNRRVDREGGFSEE